MQNALLFLTLAVSMLDGVRHAGDTGSQHAGLPRRMGYSWLAVPKLHLWVRKTGGSTIFIAWTTCETPLLPLAVPQCPEAMACMENSEVCSVVFSRLNDILAAGKEVSQQQVSSQLSVDYSLGTSAAENVEHKHPV